ncbi:MAG: hypothetical protein Q8R26_02410 [bacterium]|nr:hypothetical protein [bacterium]
MIKKLVVGSDQKPNPVQLLEMYEKLDAQTKEIKGQMKRGALTSRHIQALIEHSNPFLKKEEVTAENDGFSVMVNYDLSVESLVEHGKYDDKDGYITSDSFQTSRKGEANLSLELVHFNRALTSEEVHRELAKQGRRPAELRELLSFGIKYPDEQRKYLIVALGSVWLVLGEYRTVPYLCGSRVVWCGLDWNYFDSLRWREDYRFAAVRK